MKLPTMSVSQTDHNPHMDESANNEMDHWRCAFAYQGRRMAITFSMGMGNHGREPTVSEVLECLFSDANSGAESFADFCGNYGYDTDSRRAERTWKQCASINVRLRRLMGEDFDRLAVALKGGAK